MADQNSLTLVKPGSVEQTIQISFKKWHSLNSWSVHSMWIIIKNRWQLKGLKGTLSVASTQVDRGKGHGTPGHVLLILCNAWQSLSWCVGSTHVHGGTCLHDFPIKLHTWRVMNYYTLINISGFAFKLSLNFVKETISQEGTSQPTLSNCPCLLVWRCPHYIKYKYILYLQFFLHFRLRRVPMGRAVHTSWNPQCSWPPALMLWDRVLQDTHSSF